jgi:iron complex outermembrane receptor protein
MTAQPKVSRHLRASVTGGLISAGALILLLNTSALAADEGGDQSVAALQQMSIEDLGNIQVTSVSKTPESLSDAASAVYVITHDEIMRSGASSLPEILRLAPNLEVAQVSANSYAITARGFNGTTTSNGAGNKLLVLIDGRSVYTPLYAGVFWDLQYVLPEDIDRIEVISGPGAALWGANAVNGVINIITKNSADTQGGVVKAQAGNLDTGASAQYGGRIDDETTLRIYGMGFHRRHDVTDTGADAEDGWEKFQGGFRLDWTPDNALLTVQGDIFQGSEDQAAPPNAVSRGHNLLARWTEPLDNGASLRIQAYYDYNTIYVPGSLGNSLRTYDLDVQHNFSWGADQAIVWGGDYRYMEDKFDNIASIKFLPPLTTQRLASAFVQDTIALSDTVNLIAGTKVEDDPFIAVQFLPSLRMSWKPDDGNLLWASVSRAVRAPSLWDRDLNELSGSTTFLTGGHFEEEKLTAYEAGYRAEPLTDLSFSLSLYYNVYDDLRSVEPSPGPSFPLLYGNMMEGTAYGAEFWGNYAIADWWRLTAGFNWEHKDLRFKPGSFSPLLGQGTFIAGDDPAYQASLRSSMDITPDVALDIALRDVGSLPNPAVPSYAEMDANLSWKVFSDLQVSLSGFNLLHDHHAEFLTTGGSNEVPRSVMASVRWTL